MMSETSQAEIRNSPLYAAHLHLGATMKERNGWLVPESYGDRLFEYAAVRESGAGMIDLSSRGRIHVSGSEAIQFLNGLITNDLKTLPGDRWMPAAFPNVQGRLIAHIRVICCEKTAAGRVESPTFLLDTEAATHERALKTIERFTLAGDFRVRDLNSETAMITIQGKQAAQVIESVLGHAVQTMPNDGAISIPWQNAAIMVIRATHSGENGFDLIVKSEQASELWQVLNQSGAQPVGFDAFEVLRLEAGQPRFGIDMDETTVVTEAGLDDAVSFTKGCYVGQEIIARIKYRGHVAKRLTGVLFDCARKIERGVKIRSVEGREIGTITSVTYSPHLGRTIALGYVKYDYLAPGTEVRLNEGQEEVVAQIAAPPFVQGSWPGAERKEANVD